MPRSLARRPALPRRFAPAWTVLAVCLAAAARPAPAQPAAPDTLRPPPFGATDRVSARPTPPPREVEGRGEREIVLIHGLGASAQVWDEMVPVLSRAFRVWAYELPGHGRTPPLPKLTIQTAADDLGRFLKEQGIALPVIVGHAMGGIIAMRYAFDHPADVKRLVVIDAAPKQLATQEQKSWTVDQLLRNYDAFVASSLDRVSPDEDLARRVVDQALRTDRASFSSLLMSSFSLDMTEELPRQAVPILVIGTERFFPEGQEARRQLDWLGYDKARTVSFKRLDNVGHFAMLEQPTYLSSMILAWAAAR